MNCRPVSRRQRCRPNTGDATSADTVVKPHFQEVLSLSSIVSAAAKKNPNKMTASIMFSAAAPGPPQTGLTFFPPMNCNPTIVAAPPSASHLMAVSFAAADAATVTYFNWADSKRVAKVLKWKTRDPKLGPYTQPVPNQLQCGSCWAVAAASTMSDRWAIWTQTANPVLSATNILGCVSDGKNVKGALLHGVNTDGCNGGIPAVAADLLVEYGVVDTRCVSYEWCSEYGVCNGDDSIDGDIGAHLDSVIPACGKMMKTCLACPGGGDNCTPEQATTHNILKCSKYDDGSNSISLTNPAAIKKEIMANGPVVGAYAVFQDFQAGTAKGVGDDWAPTKNVYCNVQGASRKPYENTPYAGMSETLTGYHAVVIVGWGVEKNVNDWTRPGKKISLPYWIVRNSWSPKWNKNCSVGNKKFPMPGYFKIAITNQALSLNTEVYLDRAKGGALGGATAFKPDIARVNFKRKKGDKSADDDDEDEADHASRGGGVVAPKSASASSWNYGDHMCTKVSGDGGKYSSSKACVDANLQEMSSTCTNGECVVKADGSGKTTYGKCTVACSPEDMASCRWQSGTCTLDAQGKYTASECKSKCKYTQELYIGLIISGCLVAIFLILFFSLYYTVGPPRKNGKA